MGTTTKKLHELLKNIEEGDLVLPEIQRDFVWSKRSVLMLFDSLYRGLPIGHMLVWRTRKGPHTKAFAHGERIGNRGGYGYLLDGQQRLTAVRIVREAHDDYPLGFWLWPDDESNPHANRFSWWHGRHDDNPWALEVARVLSPSFSASEVIESLRTSGDDWEYSHREHEDAVRASIQRLLGILDYTIGITEYESDDYRDATELFVRFNSTGRRLNRLDLALSELALRVPSIVAKGMEDAATKHAPNYVFTRPFLVQCLLAVLTSRQKLKEAATVWQDTPEREVREAWNRTAKGLSRAVELLTGTLHWDTNSWVPSLVSLIPLVYTLAHGGPPSQEDRSAARKWLTLVGLRRYFSGAGYSEIDRLLAKVTDAPSPTALLHASQRALGKVVPSDFETHYRAGASMSLYISMLREHDARDWFHHTPLNGTVVGHNAELQVHHFFPQALLKQRGHHGDWINTFANYTVINKATNLNIGKDEPSDYIPRLEIRESDLVAQCIPLDRDLWRVERYEDFVKVRQKLLAKAANEYLG